MVQKTATLSSPLGSVIFGPVIRFLVIVDGNSGREGGSCKYLSVIRCVIVFP